MARLLTNSKQISYMISGYGDFVTFMHMDFSAEVTIMDSFFLGELIFGVAEGQIVVIVIHGGVL